MPSAAAVAYAALKRQVKAAAESAMERAVSAAATTSTSATATWRGSVDAAKAAHRVESRAVLANGLPDNARRAAAGPALRTALDRASTARTAAEATATSELSTAASAFSAAQGRVETALDAAIASIPA